MGLDMYLFKHNKFKNNNDEHKAEIRNLSEEVCYWRKANQIRDWMVRHTDLDVNDNCEYVEVTADILEKLKEDCSAVLSDHSLADKIMPTSSGFFFGDTKYDNWYFEDLRFTVDKINSILSHTDFNTEMIEYTEWW